MADDYGPMVKALLGPQSRAALDRFRGVDPETGETDYWGRGGLAGLMGMPSALEQSPQDVAMGFAGSVTPKVGGLLSAGAKPIRAYHGSPHDFDKFDLSKIGTGEGAQAYGHGLYFAENEGVARGYRNRLAGGKPDNVRPDEEAMAFIKPQWEETVNQLRIAREKSGGRMTDETANLQNKLDALNDHAVADTLARKPYLKDGRMYEVDIHADPSRFLDWDKPLKEQSGASQQALSEMLAKARKSFPAIDPQGNPIAGQVHHLYAQHRGGNTPAISEELAQAGIPGIKYLDQGSRGSGSGTSNYVAFDPSIIEILRKYGIAGLMGGGAAAGASGDAAAQSPIMQALTGGVP